MYTGGIDHRKNIEGLIRAFASLPAAIRTEHQLAVICAINPDAVTRLEYLANRHGLSGDDLVLTGFVPEDDLLALYRLCTVFVFPSLHEGFGLPALEAMSCGSAVIGSNVSSIPEVIGHQQALFDPHSDEAITAKLSQVLTDDTFRTELKRRGLEQAQKFSWSNSGIRVIAALEQLLANTQQKKNTKLLPVRRPTLAYISPLPPARSGISDYSIELLPELARHYDIDLIASQDPISIPWVRENFTIRDVEWFRSHADRYDRILYHFGNSHFHQHMFSLLDEIPGTVVLHDFFLSHIIAHMDSHGTMPGGLPKALHDSHGHSALYKYFHNPDKEDSVWEFPCNLGVLRSAQGIIVHSENSLHLAQHWYAGYDTTDWTVIPHLRIPATKYDRERSRIACGINADDFAVCSFGLLGPTKLNDRLLRAWMSSKLAGDRSCKLVFVGDNSDDEYGRQLINTIQKSGLKDRVSVTGWADSETFKNHLAAADVAVQLRTLSRGETSGTVLDCMNYGLPLIVNANGSMADLPNEATWKLPDEFSDEQLIEALEKLRVDANKRLELGKNAREIIHTHHSPRLCAERYFSAIEDFHRSAANGIHALIGAIARLEMPVPDPNWLMQLSQSIAQSIPQDLIRRQLFLDVSVLVQVDSKSGIQRVVRSILRELLTNPPSGFAIEPVYANSTEEYRYARRFTLDFLDCPTDVLNDEPIEYQAGDIFLGLDLNPIGVALHRDYYQQLRHFGVQVKFVVYDLLCVIMPHNFRTNDVDNFRRWLDTIALCDGAVCISNTVAEELNEWIHKSGPERLRHFDISWFHLGAGIEKSTPSLGMPDDAATIIDALSAQATFLMVGTIEPRKGHALAIAAFDQLWKAGVAASLVIVGKKGWMVDALATRIREHPEHGKRLYWLENASDEYLEKLYASATCIIAASEGEGFGLPLIEAAQLKKPIIARNIPVFREVAGDHAFYFDGSTPRALADAIRDWLKLYESDQHPQPNSIPWLSWEESAVELLKALDVDKTRNNATSQ
jgi:glycosyltransferase involved in cell wall biosynthesis